MKQPLGGLVFRKDPTRPGGGVFVARDTTNEAVDKHLPQGTIINERTEGETLASSHEAATANWALDGAAPQPPHPHPQHQYHRSPT